MPVMSQHFMPRQGSRRGSENALLMNRYDCELVRDGQKWRFKRVTIDNAWARQSAYDEFLVSIIAITQGADHASNTGERQNLLHRDPGH